MDRFQKQLLKRATKAGIKASKKRNHLIGKEELLELKIQTLPIYVRIFLFISGASGLAIGIPRIISETTIQNTVLTASSALLILFAIIGIKRTLRFALEAVEEIDTTKRTDEALNAVASAVRKVFNAIDIP